MIYQRGNPLDYEGWGSVEGMETWKYANCLPLKIRKNIWCR